MMDHEIYAMLRRRTPASGRRTPVFASPDQPQRPPASAHVVTNQAFPTRAFERRSHRDNYHDDD